MLIRIRARSEYDLVILNIDCLFSSNSIYEFCILPVFTHISINRCRLRQTLIASQPMKAPTKKMQTNLGSSFNTWYGLKVSMLIFKSTLIHNGIKFACRFKYFIRLPNKILVLLQILLMTYSILKNN